jgi:hypothetical protein
VGVSEQHGVNPCLSGPYPKYAKSELDPAGIPVHQQQFLSFTFQEQFPRRGRADIAIPGHVDYLDIQGMREDAGVFTAVAEMEQDVECTGQITGLKGQRDISMAVGHNKDTHAGTVADSVF